VALKLLHPHFSFSHESLSRFRREAGACARVIHPVIVVVHAVGEAAGFHFIAQELVPEGLSLADNLAEMRELDELPEGYYERLASLFAVVADGLQAAHEEGVIHRDIKPSNILLSADNRPKIVDFGLALVQDDLGLSRTGQLVGTPYYMSPEQAASKRMGLDHRTDVFSLGATLYEALTLRRPFEGDTSQQVLGRILVEDPQDPRRLRSRVPDDLAVICLKALEKSPERRYASAADMAADLRCWLTHEPIRARPTGRVRRAAKWVRRHPTWSATAALGLVSMLIMSALVTLEVKAAQAAAEASAEADKARTAAELAKEDTRRELERARSVSDLLQSVFLRPKPLELASESQINDIQARVENVFGHNDPNVVAFLTSMGASRIGDLISRVQGQQLLQRAIDYRDKNLAGMSGSSSAIPMGILASSNLSDSPAESVSFARLALDRDTAEFGPESLEAAYSGYRWATIVVTLTPLLGLQKELSKAEVQLATATALFERDLGREAALASMARAVRGQALYELNRRDEALEALWTAHNSFRSNAFIDPSIRFTTANMLAELLKKRKDIKRAQTVYKDLPNIVESFFGRGTPGYERYVQASVSELRELGLFDDAASLEATLTSAGQAQAEQVKRALDLAAGGHHKEALQTLESVQASLRKEATASTAAGVMAQASLETTLLEVMVDAGEQKRAEELSIRHANELRAKLGESHDLVSLADGLTAQIAATKDSGASMRALRLLVDRTHEARRYSTTLLLIDRMRALAERSGDERARAEVRELREREAGPREAPLRFDGFEDDPTGGLPAQWFQPNSRGVGNIVTCVVDDEHPFEGRRSLRVDGLEGVDSVLQSERGFRNVLRSFRANEFRGKQIHFSAAVRVQPKEGKERSQAQLWLRADRPKGAEPSLFDNMDDRPIRSAEWHRYEIVGPVPDDAEYIVVGMMVFGEATAWLDDIRIE
jgi:tetratricopeptide (TPR) repeat protein